MVDIDFENERGIFGYNGEKLEADQMRRRAVLLLRKLSRFPKGQTPEERWKVRRHLYHFTGQHLKNYRLGAREVARGNRIGYLSMALGPERTRLSSQLTGKPLSSFSKLQGLIRKIKESR
jgi:hypothetical protein